MSAVERYVDDSTIRGITNYAEKYSGSEFFKDARSVEKAFVIISAGAEIGIAPFAAITGIALIQGKPVIGAGILAGLVKSHPKYDYLVDVLTDDECSITFYQGERKLGTSTFTIADARRANLAGKDVWKNYPRNMLFARAISNGVAFYTPDVTTTRVYVEGELDDVPQPRPIASARPEAASAGSPLVTEETIVDVEPLVEADPVVVHATTAESPRPLEPETSASASTPSQRVKETLNSLSEGETAAVYEACDALGIKRTVSALRARFGSDAESRETLLPALAAAVNSPARVEGEIAEPTADTPEEFEAWLTQQHADEKQRQTQLAKAGAYGK